MTMRRHNNNPLLADDTISTLSTNSADRRRVSLRRRSIGKVTKPEQMPRLTSSISGPVAMGARTLPRQEASFGSDISLLSTSSAHESKAWFCGACSYRNCDALSATCALCGSSRAVSRSGRETIFTIDSSINLVSRPEGLSLRSSVTTCSRTTGTSVSTKVVSNCTDALKNRRRRRVEDDETVAQPPAVSHASPYRRKAVHHDDDDDDVSVASDVTRRRGSSSSSSSNNSDGVSSVSLSQFSAPLHPSKLNAEATAGCGNESGSEASESSRRRATPHDDPVEQPRRRRRQSPGAFECPAQPVRATEETPEELCPLPGPKKGRKKKSIRDFLPGLRGRRRSSATASTSASSSSRLSQVKNQLDVELTSESEPSFHSHRSDQFELACRRTQEESIPRFRALAPRYYV